MENPQPFVWNPDRILFHHVARWPSGLAKDHKYSMASVRSGNHLLLRSHDCGKTECTKYSSQCQALRIIAKGGKNMTYANGTAQFHWGVSPKDRWALFDVKKDQVVETIYMKDNHNLFRNSVANMKTGGKTYFQL